jgi:sodium-coupled neutral amino acid transporter 11
MARFAREENTVREEDSRRETELLIDATEDNETTNSQASPDFHNGADLILQARPGASPLGQRRASSFAKKASDGTPRTPNRVRFDFDHDATPVASHAQAPAAPRVPIVLPWREGDGQEEDDDDEDTNQHAAARGGDTQRVPLLTDIEAPSVTLALAEDDDFNPEDLLETSRPKSGMRSAFMNMANSIM